jgi:quinohemoprotein ethanol dehydrogenase
MLRILSLLAVAGFAANVGAAEPLPIDSAGANWASGGRAFDEQHYSPLTQINSKNVGKLGLAWSLDLPGEATLEATPLAIDGVLYFTGQLSKVYAVEAASGKLLWSFDPETYARRASSQPELYPANRGVAYWNGKVYVGVRDGRLMAIDAKTGKQVWSVETLDPKSHRLISGAPRAYNGKILIGHSGGDFGERGYLTAYDAETGAQVWRFYTAPGDPAKGFEDDAQALAAQTWGGEWWKTGTGGTVWDSFTYDPELNRVYIGTGNSGPYNPEIRSPGGGDNLFLVSIVAVDADTGKYIWHYQMNPREAWDWKATQNIALTKLKIDGKEHRVLMQAPSNGFYYVIDRDTGKLLSAGKTGKVTWAERIDLTTGRPVEVPNIRYQDGPIVMWPSGYGTHNWQPMAFSPQTNLAYIPYIHSSARYELGPNGIARRIMIKHDPDDGTGRLLAWDPVTQTERWSIRRERMWSGGVAATAGNLVFQGDGDGIFHAHDALTGKEVWQFDAKLGIIGAPITYMVGGKQYISLLVGIGGATIGLASPYGHYGWKYGAQPRRLLTFALNAKAQLPPTAPRDFKLYPKDDPKLVIDDAAATQGAKIFNMRFCITCHGIGAYSNGAPGPDLRESDIALNYETFAEFIRSGAAADRAMPKFEISDDDARALFMFIRSSARTAAKTNPAK